MVATLAPRELASLKLAALTAVAMLERAASAGRAGEPETGLQLVSQEHQHGDDDADRELAEASALSLGWPRGGGCDEAAR